MVNFKENLVDSKFLPAVILVVIFVLLTALITYVKYEPVNVTSELLEARIIGHDGGRTGKSLADPYFIVELPSGKIIRVKDFGEIPFSYIGPIHLNRVSGKVSGYSSYRISNRKGQNEKSGSGLEL